MKGLIIVLGCIGFGVMCLQGDSYRQWLKKKRKVKSFVSEEDARRYAGMHVMTDGRNGPVVVADKNFDDMMAEAALFDNHIRDRLVYIYIPRSDETLIGGHYYRPVRSA